MRKQILLLEMYNLRTMLLENRLEFLKKNYLPRIAQYVTQVALPQPVIRAAKIAPEEMTPENAEGVAEKLLAYVASFDPDPTKKNTQWLLNLLMKTRNDGNGNVTRAMQFEDLPATRDLLVQFQQHARALPAQSRDIMRFKSPGDLAAVLQPLAQQAPVASNREVERQEERKMYAQSTVLFNDAQYRIVIPHTREAAMYFGRNTRWCTAASKNNMFSHYNERGQLYVILDKKNNKRWQFHWEDNQFMDEMDRLINKNQFCAEHPTIAKFFEDYMSSGEVIAHIGECTLYKNDNAIIIRSQDEEDASRRGIHARPAEATLALKDGYIVSGDISVLFSATRRRRSYFNNTFTSFPLDINDGGDVVEALMNKIGMPVRAAIQNQLADVGVFGNDQGEFGSLSDMGRSILSVGGGMQWMELDSGSLKFFALVQNGEEITYARLNTGQGEDHGLFEASAPNMNKPEGQAESKALFALVTHLPDITRFPTDNNYYNSDDFDELQAKQIMSSHKDLADLGVLFKALGPNDPRVQKAVIERLRAADYSVTEKSFLNGGKRIALNEFKDIAEFIGQWGTDYTQKVAGQLFDGDFYDSGHEEEADRSATWDFILHLKKVNPPLFAKLGAWVAETCSSEIEQRKEDDEDYEFDPNDIDEWFDLLEENGDDGLQMAANSAYQTGSSRGAEADMFERFTQDIEGYPDLYFMVRNEPERPHQLEMPFKGDENDVSEEPVEKFMHDTKVVIAPEVGRVIKALLSPEWEEEIGNTGGSWLEYLQEYVGENDVKLNHEEPYYGYSGHDEESANEHFAEEIYQLVN